MTGKRKGEGNARKPRPRGAKKIKLYKESSDTEDDELLYRENEEQILASRGTREKYAYKPPKERGQTPIIAVGERASNSEKLHIYCVAVGEGNATIVLTPSNDLFIVDMGSKTPEIKYGFDDTDSEVNPKNQQNVGIMKLYELLAKSEFLGQNKVVEGLILSHSDQDHYNYISTLYELDVWVKKAYLGDFPGNFSAQPKTVLVPVEEENKPTTYKSSKYKGNSDDYLAQLCGSATVGKDEASGEVNWVTFTGVFLNDPNIQGCPSVLPPSPPKKTKSGSSTEPTPSCLPSPVQKFLQYIPSSKTKSSGSGKIYPEDIRWYGLQPTEIDISNDINQLPYYSENGLTLYKAAGGVEFNILVSNYRDCDDMARIARSGSGQITYDKFLEYSYAIPRMSSAREKNEASVVSDIKVGKLHHLICGDAIGSNEAFLTRMYPTIANIPYLCIPHHGSNQKGSSSKTWVNQMNPGIVVISTRRFPSTNKHPQLSTVKLYLRPSTEDNDVESIYTACTLDPQETSDNVERLNDANGQLVYQYTQARYRLYVTGWMLANYHHYSLENELPTTVTIPGEALFKSKFTNALPTGEANKTAAIPKSHEDTIH